MAYLQRLGIGIKVKDVQDQLSAKNRDHVKVCKKSSREYNGNRNLPYYFINHFLHIFFGTVLLGIYCQERIHK